MDTHTYIHMRIYVRAMMHDSDGNDDDNSEWFNEEQNINRGEHTLFMNATKRTE